MQAACSPLSQAEPQWALAESERTVFQTNGQVSVIMASAEDQLWDLSTQVRRNKTKEMPPGRAAPPHTAKPGKAFFDFSFLP